MTPDARYWIERLDLVEHPEGGCYRETYRSEQSIPGSGAHPAGRSFSTAIFYLLRSGDVSRFHRLRSDEVFHHYAGSPFILHVLHPGGGYDTVALGHDPERGEVLQAVIPAGAWFGATIESPDTFALVGCSVAPGFEFSDFEPADRAKLIADFPAHTELVERLT